MTARPQDGNVTYLRTHRPFIIHEGPKPDYVKWLAERAEFEPLDLNDALAESLQADPDEAESLGWSVFFGGALLGFIAGLAAVAVPAIVIAWVIG